MVGRAACLSLVWSHNQLPTTNRLSPGTFVYRPVLESVGVVGYFRIEMTVETHESHLLLEWCAEGANVIVLVCDNGMYGTIRMHQQKHYPKRVSGTVLKNPDFAALARAHGGHGETVAEDAAFAPALERARAAGVPAIIHLKMDPAALSPRLRLED